MSDLQELLEKARRGFAARFAVQPDLLAYAPGRINVIGGHTDYNEGLALPAAIDRWIIAALRLRKDETVNVHSLDFNDEISFRLSGGLEPKTSWQRYILGASELIEEYFNPTRGFDGLITGNVPTGAGVSSSAALEVALLNGLRGLYNSRMDDITLIRLCSRIEKEYLGLPSGLLDQYASQFSREGKLLIIDFRTLSHRYVSSGLSGWTWVVVDSGVSRQLAGSAYRDRVEECAEGLCLVRKAHPEVRHFRDVTREHVEELAGTGEGRTARRLRHYLEENRRVLRVEKAISESAPLEVGRLLLQSHESLRDLYEVSSPELDFLIETSVSWDGCAGGRLIGGGFGGCILNLLRDDRLGGFAEYVRGNYISRFECEPRLWCFNLAGGAGINHVPRREK